MWLLALCIVASVPAPAELVVYRSAAELPPRIARLLPRDFDFSKEWVAVAAQQKGRLELVTPSEVQESEGEIRVRAPAERLGCPPCQGIVPREPPPAALSRVVVYRLKRFEGRRVFELPALPSAPRLCRPCLVP